MAQTITNVELGLEIEGAVVTTQYINGDADPSAGGGVAAPVGSDYNRNIAGVNGGEKWFKFGDADTDWIKIADASGPVGSSEDGNQNTYMGKTVGAGGNENPSYSSTNNYNQGDDLTTAVGGVDDAVGADSEVTPITRTVGDVTAADSAKANIDDLDTAIGGDAAFVSPTYVSAANDIQTNINALDTELELQDSRLDSLETGQIWIEAVNATTGDDLTSKSGLAPLTDDDGGVYTPVAGERVASTFDNKIYTVVTPGAWTVAHTLAAGETFFTEFNLPDPVNEEKGAAYTYNGSAMVKVADFDFESADSIGLTGGYAPANGSVTSSDTVEAAVQKLDGNQIDLITLSGNAQGATDNGTFTGDVIADNETTRGALQDLEDELGTDAQLTPELRTTSPVSTTNTKNQNIDALDASIGDDADLGSSPILSTGNTVNQNLAAVAEAVEDGSQGEANGIGGTPVTVDEIDVNEYGAVEWLLTITDTANQKRTAYHVYATHNGSIDGVTDANDSDASIQLKQVSGGNIAGQSPGTITVDLSGTGAAQRLRLRVSNASVTVQARVRRHAILI
jgi:hypothetical protein